MGEIIINITPTKSSAKSSAEFTIRFLDETDWNNQEIIEKYFDISSMNFQRYDNAQIYFEDLVKTWPDLSSFKTLEISSILGTVNQILDVLKHYSPNKKQIECLNFTDCFVLEKDTLAEIKKKHPAVKITFENQ